MLGEHGHGIFHDKSESLYVKHEADVFELFMDYMEEVDEASPVDGSVDNILARTLGVIVTGNGLLEGPHYHSHDITAVNAVFVTMFKVPLSEMKFLYVHELIEL